MSTTEVSLPRRDTPFSGRATSVEWPTVAIGLMILGLYGLITLAHDRLPTIGVIVGLGVIAAWWSSFQHELIHGHPFRSDRANEMIGSFAMTLWIPYRVYRRLHLEHHRGEALTDPFDDPESFYCDENRWRRANRLSRTMMWVNRTFVGRMIIGPPIALTGFLGSELARLRGRDRTAWRDWSHHALWVTVTGVWAFGVAGVPLWQYVLGTVWVGTSIIQVRSFAEHVYRVNPDARTAFVDGFFPFGLLFLFNNMHHAHHARPAVPWYQLPRLANHLGSRRAAEAGAGYYRGYREVLRLYGAKPFCVPVDPSTPAGAALRHDRSAPTRRSVRA